MTKTKRHLIYFITVTNKTKNNIKNKKQIQKNKVLATAQPRSLVGVQFLTAASIPIIALLVITNLRDLFIAETAYSATTEPLVDSTEWLVRPPNVREP